MFIRITSTPKSPRKSVKIVKSVRDGYKVKQIMLHHVGTASSEWEIEKLKQIGREFIAKEQQKLRLESDQISLFNPVSSKEHLLQMQSLEKIKTSKKSGRIPKVKLRDILWSTTIII
jgi:hypothetical protein